MKPEELYNFINNTSCIHSGLDVDWAVVPVEEENALYVIFQGSTTKSDWIHNFEFLPRMIRPYRNMRHPWYCHTGFADMYHSIRDELLIKVKATCDNRRVIVAGFSQGGGLAHLCCEDLAWHGYKVECVTFGSPNVFYGYQARKHLHDLQVAATNYENGSDIVPKVPPFAFKLNPIHVGEQFCLLKSFNTYKYHMGYGNPDLYK